MISAQPAFSFDFECSDFRPMLQDKQLERPSAPYCIERYGQFSDEYEFDSCKRELQDFERKIREYLSCLNSESDQAVKDYNEAVEAFNRRARN
jgi:hypothetical protein